MASQIQNAAFSWLILFALGVVLWVIARLNVVQVPPVALALIAIGAATFGAFRLRRVSPPKGH